MNTPKSDTLPWGFRWSHQLLGKRQIGGEGLKSNTVLLLFSIISYAGDRTLHMLGKHSTTEPQA
jgi:hypothetical protein